MKRKVILNQYYTNIYFYLILFIFIGSLFDAIFSKIFYDIGVIDEINPLMNLIIHYDSFILIKMLLTSIFLYLLLINLNNKVCEIGILFLSITYLILIFYEISIWIKYLQL